MAVVELTGEREHGALCSVTHLLGINACLVAAEEDIGRGNHRLGLALVANARAGMTKVGASMRPAISMRS